MYIPLILQFEDIYTVIEISYFNITLEDENLNLHSH